MEEAAELGNYLPVSFKTRSEQYISFPWEAFETNYTHRKYQFAVLAYHMLTMSFVYFNIWQIKQAWPEAFRMATGRLQPGQGKGADRGDVVITFWRVNESGVLRFLKLIGCDNAQVRTYAALVKDRNNSAHPNGHIFVSTQATLDTAEILRVVDEIQTHSKPVIEHAYRDFLLQNYDPEEREYSEVADQIREVLIHENYLSQEDIDICLGFDVAGLVDQPAFESIRALHEALISGYGPDMIAARSINRLLWTARRAAAEPGRWAPSAARAPAAGRTALARGAALDQPGRRDPAAMRISANSRNAPWPPWAAHTMWACSRTSTKASPGQAHRPASAMASRSLTSSPM